jgi:hypothetical protein
MELTSSSTSSDCWLYAINAIRYRRVRRSVLVPINTTEALRRVASRLTISSRVAGGPVASVGGTRDRTWPDLARGIGLVSKSLASQFRLDLDTGWLLENRKTASGIAFPKGPAVPLLTPSWATTGAVGPDEGAQGGVEAMLID